MLHLHLSVWVQQQHFMVPEVAVNFFTLLQGNTLLLNVRGGVHCFYNLYIAVVRISGRACILPNLLPCPLPKLTCMERFQPGKRISSTNTRDSKRRNAQRSNTAFPKSREMQQPHKKAPPGDVKLQCNNQPKAVIEPMVSCGTFL